MLSPFRSPSSFRKGGCLVDETTVSVAATFAAALCFVKVTRRGVGRRPSPRIAEQYESCEGIEPPKPFGLYRCTPNRQSSDVRKNDRRSYVSEDFRRSPRLSYGAVICIKVAPVGFEPTTSGS